MRKILLTIFIIVCLFKLHGQDTLVMPLTGNGGVFNTCYAVIYDNGLDSNYKNFSHSTLTIAPLWVQNINLYFEEFNTEIHFDSLSIYDGPATTFPLIGTYSGNSLEGQTVSSTGNSLTLEFRSDDIQTGSGFKAWVSCLMGNEEWTFKNITLYPNPAHTCMQINGLGELEGVRSISLLDQQGRILENRVYNGTIDVTDITPGLYGLLIQLKDGKTIFLKWIKC